MKSSINPQGSSEFARTGAEVLERCHVAAAGHNLNAVRCSKARIKTNPPSLPPPKKSRLFLCKLRQLLAHRVFGDRELLRQRLVGAITKHAVGALLAGTEINRAVFRGGVGNGRKSGAFVRSIAEWLGLALAARAPIVGLASFDSDSNGGGLGDFGFVHCDGRLIFVRRTRVKMTIYLFSLERPTFFSP